MNDDFCSFTSVQHAMEHENLNSQIEAACTLVEKLITENAELVEKVLVDFLQVIHADFIIYSFVMWPSKASQRYTFFVPYDWWL